MAVQIFTDSGADIPYNNDLGVHVVPLHVSFGDEEYLDGVEIGNVEFYDRLVESDSLPKTAAASPFEFEDAFKKYVDVGDDVIIITISAKLSGTYQNASIAAENYEDKVRVIDSAQVTVSQNVLVRYAARLASEGMNVDDIIKEIESKKDKVQLVALLDTLEYLKMGGRISQTSAIMGSVLSIKPVLVMKDGELEVAGKARGSKNAANLIHKRMEEVGGIDFDMPYVVGYTGLSDALLQKYLEDNKSIWEPHTDELDIVHVGAVIGTHAGPGAIALAFFAV